MRKENELYHWCTKCGAILNNQNGFDPDEPFWKCQKCGANLYDPEGIYQGERFEGVFWHCDKCDALLNIQEGFSDLYDYWKCKICSHVNRIAESEIDDYTKQFEVDNEELINRNFENIQKSKASNKLFRFCTYCGCKISTDSCFCPNCGKSIRKKSDSVQENTNKNECFLNTSTNNQQYESLRKETYDGEIRKCPNCGEVLKSFTPNCPSCGYELRNSKTANCVYKFSRKLDSVSSTKRKDDLIRHFVIPNTKEDIIEFILLAAANLEAGGNNSDAWMIKLEYAYKKAVFVFGNDPEIERIKRIYYGAVNDYKEIQRAKKQKLNSDYFSSHWIGIFAAIIVVISIILIFLGSVFGVGPTWDWTSTETSGHLWWKTQTYTNHHWPILTIIGIILGGIFLIIGIIFGSIQSSRYKRRK